MKRYDTDTSPARVTDTVVAARTASLAVFVAALWFFVSPWAYYGVSDEVSARNCWIVGALMIAFSGARLWQPRRLRAASYVDLALGIWVVISPWIFGYVNNTGQLVNSLCVGAVVIAFSIVAIRNSRGSGLPEVS